MSVCLQLTKCRLASAYTVEATFALNGSVSFSTGPLSAAERDELVTALFEAGNRLESLKLKRERR